MSTDGQTFVGQQAAAPVPITDRWSQGSSTAATRLEREAITAKSEKMNAALNKGCQGSINTLAFRASKLRFTLSSRYQL
jgi:hypothetical protein